MKKILLILAVFASFTPAFADEEIEAKAQSPEWISSPNKGCMMDEICVLGSGKDLRSATINAQNEMLRVFENSLKSTYKSEVSADDTEMKEFSSEQVESLTEGMVSGTKVKKTFSDGEFFYVQSSLDKEEARANIRTEMASVDKKMKVLVEDKTVSAMTSLKKLYAYREALNKRYAFLNNGTGIKEAVSYNDVFMKKKEASKDKVVAIRIVEPKGKRITNAVKKILTENGVKVSGSSYNIELKGELLIEKEHMNVAGFIKNFYIFNVETVDINGNVVGSLYITLSENGRSENQALNKAMSRIIDEIKENFDDLAI